MENIATNWSRPEFKAYLLSYAANANYFESDEEKKVILSYVSEAEYFKIHKELDQDNDYQSIQKILYNIDKYNYSKDELQTLISDIKNLFDSDGDFDILEDNMLHALKRLIA